METLGVFLFALCFASVLMSVAEARCDEAKDCRYGLDRLASVKRDLDATCRVLREYVECANRVGCYEDRFHANEEDYHQVYYNRCGGNHNINSGAHFLLAWPLYLPALALTITRLHGRI